MTSRGVRVGAMTAIVIIGGIGMITWIQSPAKASLNSVTKNSGTATNAAALASKPETKQVGGTDLQTPYFDLELPTGYIVRNSTEDAGGAIKGAYSLVNVQPRHVDEIGITIGELGLLNLKEIAAVKVRSTQPENYRPTSREYVPEGGIVYEHIGTYEIGIFVKRGSTYVAFVASGTASQRQTIESALKSVVTGIKWKE